jgi:hypothetical protein
MIEMDHAVERLQKGAGSLRPPVEVGYTQTKLRPVSFLAKFVKNRQEFRALDPGSQLGFLI